MRLQFETGKFKQPVSYEQLIQDRYVPTMERSMIDQLVPARDVGSDDPGHKVFDDRLEYGVAVSNGEINGNTDTNNDKDINGRIAVRPFNDPDCCSIFRHLQFGISRGWGIENEPINPTTLKTPATVPWFAYKSGVRAEGPAPGSALSWSISTTPSALPASITISCRKCSRRPPLRFRKTCPSTATTLWPLIC